MPQSPLVTIVLPTYNRPEVLTFAIQSVLDQTVEDFELLVLGDGCTDDTAEVVASFADHRIRWFDLPKAPYYGYANINVGLKAAAGEFIAYMAHDDLWLPDHLELLLPYFEDDTIEIAYSRPLWISPQGDIYPLSFNLHEPEVLEVFVSMKRNSLPAATFVFRSRCLERYGGWDETLTENADWEEWARIIRLGGRHNFAYLPQPTCLHFRAKWKTEANPGPADLFTWKHRSDQDLIDPVFVVPVEGYPTEQAAFAARLKADPVSFSRDIRIECQRALDRLAMEGDLMAVDTIHRLRDLERANQSLCSQVGVFEYIDIENGGHIVFGPGFFEGEDDGRWMWRDARMIFFTGNGPVKVSLSLRCGEAANYDQFPLTVELKVNGSSIQNLRFKSPRKKMGVDFVLEQPVSVVSFISNSTFSPSRCGINEDRRELSVRLTKIRIKVQNGAGKSAFSHMAEA
ncbi:MAG: glycosyltransferase family 2 protein [Thermoleophilia bacterium]